MRSALGGGRGAVDGRCCDALAALDANAASPAALSRSRSTPLAAAAAHSPPGPRLVGPDGPGSARARHAPVYEELVGAAERSLWISTFAYYDGPQAFKTLAGRMEAMSPGCRSRSCSTSSAGHGDTTPAERARRRGSRSASGRRTGRASGGRRVSTTPLARARRRPEGVLHAKAVVADDALRS